MMAITLLLVACTDDAGDGGGASSAGSAGKAGASGATSGTGGAPSGGAAGASASAGAAGKATGGAGGSAGSGGTPPLAEFPAQVLDLANWKLTLPIPEEGGSSPLEIEQPELATYVNAPYFHPTPAGDGVLFQANCGGVTTSNSGYPRSELREMTNDGADLASWSTSSGTHTLLVNEAITHTPVAKPHVVAAQVHDSSDDVVMIRLEDQYLFVEGGGDDLGVLDDSYETGTPFTIKIVADSGNIAIYYDDMSAPKVEVARDSDGCYFKAGAYTQSNTDTGDEADAYGEVVIYDLEVTHTP